MKEYSRPRNAVPWSAEYGKPDLTEAQAMEKIAGVEKYLERLESTGGMDDTMFAMLAKSSPAMAGRMIGKDKAQIKKAMAQYRRYLETFVKSKPKNPNDPLDLGL